jgi:ABC-type Fe3+-hydroxamate transport system substrate-binding protein
MLKRLVWLALIGGVLLPLPLPPAGAQGDGFPRTVRDDTGRGLTVPALPAHIAVMGAVPALDALRPDAAITTLPPGIAPAWAGIDLLVLPDLYAAAYPDLLAGAGAADVPIYRTTPHRDLAGWRASLSALGAATGRGERAAWLARRLDAQLRAAAMLSSDAAPARVLVLTPEGYTFGQGALLTDLIAAAGGENAAAAAGFADYRQIDDPTVRALAPDVILLTPGWDDPAVFSALPGYADLPAVQAGRVYRLPFAPTPPADPGAALLLLSALLHPAKYFGA